MIRKVTALSVAMVAAVAACSSTASRSATTVTATVTRNAPTLSPATTEATDYADAGALATALNDGGLPCAYTDAIALSASAQSQGSCAPDGTDEVVLITYGSEADRDAHVQFLLQTGVVSTDAIVIGGDWLIDCDLVSDCTSAARITGGSNPR